MSDALLGTTLAGKYRIKKLMGAGGMGAVYEGEHIEIGKRVAIKVIEPSHAGSPEIAARFRREARAASAVESDHIVQVFDVGQDASAGLYMVMEYLSGEDLSARLRTDHRLEVPVVVTIGFQAARALAKAHAAGVVHRDLKPANLFLTTREDGSTHIKILDFGISKLTRDEAGSQGSITGQRGGALTRKGVVIGTPQYMSPEQAQGLPLDHRTDVWSLGAVLYEALAGVSAYQELSTYEQTIIQIVMRAPSPLAEVAPWVPRELASVIHEALTHDVTKRIQDCATLARRLVEAVPVAGSGASPRVSVPSSDEVRSRRDPGPSRQVVIHPSNPASGSGTSEVLSSTVASVGAAPPTPVGAITDGAVPLALVPPRGRTMSGVAMVPEGDAAVATRARRTRALLVIAGASMATVVAAVGLRAMSTHGTAAAVASAPMAAAPSVTADTPVAVATAVPTAVPMPPATAVPTTETSATVSAPLLATNPPPVPRGSQVPRGRPSTAKPNPSVRASPAAPAAPAAPAQQQPSQFGGAGVTNTL